MKKNQMVTLSDSHKRRLIIIVVLTLGAASVLALVLFALQQNINLYYTPSQVAAGEAPIGKRIRVGGMVVDGSIQRQAGLQIDFIVTDYTNNLSINYHGILPTLFGAGQGVVALGKLQAQNRFLAEEILAKHDEKYMPKEVADSLQQRNVSNSS